MINPEIYIATNRQTGQQYVGQTINFSQRLQVHRARLAPKTYFTRALQKHGVDAFSFIHIACPQEYLNKWEKFFIAKLGTMIPNGYNLTSGGEAKKTISEITKRKISIAKMGHSVSAATREKLRIFRTGKSLSLETRQKIRELLSGNRNPNFGKHPSAEARKMMGLVNRENKYWVGRHHTMEARKKMSIAKKGKQSWLGKHHSLETREKLRQAALRQHRKSDVLFT